MLMLANQTSFILEKKRMATTNFNFLLGEHKLNLVQQYKYLGVLLDEHMKFNECDKLFGQSAGRALSSLIGRYNVYTNFDYNIYTHLFKTILPVMLYGSEACGYYDFPCCDKIRQTHDFLFRSS